MTLLNSRATVLITPGGEHVRIPNSRIYKAIITNFTRAPERRFTFEVGIGAAVDIARAQAIALGVLRGMDSVLAQPQPIVTVDRLGGSSLVLNVSGWMNQRRSDHAKVKGEAIRQVKEAFDAAGVPMPDPTYIVRRPDPKQAGGELVEVHALLHVERNSQKPMLLGRGGQVIKAIGSEARAGMETLLGARVHLELHVTVLGEWQDDPKKLNRLGY